MALRSLTLWMALGSAVTLPAGAWATDPACDPAKVLEQARLDHAQGEGGEAGESGAAPEVRLALGLASLGADLAAGDAALAAGEPETAATLYGFALDEGYHKVAQALREQNRPGFESALAALSEAAERRDPVLAEVRRRAGAALAAEQERAAGPDRARAALDAGLDLLNRAARDWQLAVACGQVGDALAAWQARAAAAAARDLLREAAKGLGGTAPDAAAAMLREAEAVLRALPAHPVEGAPAAETGPVTAAASRALLAASELTR